MNVWLLLIYVFFGVLRATFIPVLLVMLRSVKLEDGGTSSDESPHFSQEAKTQLNHNHSRVMGTLSFWKKQTVFYKRFHYFALGWLIPLAVLIPLLSQAVTEDPCSKWLLTAVATVSAILLSFHRWLKVEQNFKAFRQGESNYYDLRRRLLDRPMSFGNNETEQLASYFAEVERIRRNTRDAETDNFPSSELPKST